MFLVNVFGYLFVSWVVQLCSHADFPVNLNLLFSSLALVLTFKAISISGGDSSTILDSV